MVKLKEEHDILRTTETLMKYDYQKFKYECEVLRNHGWLYIKLMFND